MSKTSSDGDRQTDRQILTQAIEKGREIVKKTIAHCKHQIKCSTTKQK